MAKVQFKNQSIDDATEIAMIMKEYGLLYERWGTRGNIENDEDVLTEYASEIEKLNTARGYVTADLIALKPTTPNLDVITAKFDKEHHHTDDEVRFVVEGEGVFELATENQNDDWIKFTSEPGDLVVIPAMRRHLFYLTDKKNIRCIRLFKDRNGWEAIYEKPH